MKRNIIIALLCTFTACCAWGQINAPCFTIPVPADTPTYYTLYTIDEDSTIINLDNAPIYALAITGHAYLQSPANSMVRIILVDNYGHEHLVFETNSLLSDTTVVEFLNAGRETLWENMINASHLIVRLRNATIEMNTPVLITQLLEESTPTIKRARSLAQSDTIVNVLNRHLIARDIPWRAGRTDLAEMEYNERRMILGDENPFDNIEYYIGGYYVDPAFDAAQSPAVDDGYVEEFDWRNRHGKNWITSVKDQGFCNSCGAFASTALLEAYTNLYFNNSFNINLSEQEIVSRLMTDCKNGVNPIDVSNQIYETGIMSESDLEYNYNTYIGAYIPSYIPENYNIKLYIDRPFNACSPSINTETEFKDILFKSPLCFGKEIWKHVMLLVGYKKVHQGDTIHDIYINENDLGSVIIKDTNKYIGQTVWICKNSWNTDKGINGYVNIVTDVSNLAWCSTFNGLLILEKYNETYNYDDVLITDNDGDGYYYWGCGVRPMHTPEWVPYMKDGDDGNPYLGPMENDGHCWVLGPTNDNGTTYYTQNPQIVYPQIPQGDLIIPSGVTLTITSHLFMHPDAKIFIKGGKIILDGGVIHNGHILNKGSFIVKNGGIIEMRYGDQYVHDPADIAIEDNGNTPFPIYMEVDQGSFVEYKNQ